jgi:L-lactate dehydrogenase complex protein LldE
MNYFVKNFDAFDYIVCPSGSCTLHVKDHLHDDKNEEGAIHIRKNIYELTEFLTDILKVDKLTAAFHTRLHAPELSTDKRIENFADE